MADRRLGGWVRWAPAIAFLALLAAYHAAFGRFFPTVGGTIGRDYALTFPGLLSGFYWFSTNGPWAVPWFTPAFCGGQPDFADPQAGYYSVLQFATFFVGPLTGAYVTMLAFAAAGYWGMFLLLRRSFAVEPPAAILGAAVFMYNGFFAHRMLAGHAGFHAFMLVPWIPCLLTLPPHPEDRRSPGGLVAACLAGMVAAYWVQSGFGTLIVPATLAVVAILLLRALRPDPFPTRQVVLRSLAGALVAVSISAAKVAAVVSTMSHFPRADYLLPGYETFADAVRIAFRSLFFPTSDLAILSTSVLVNWQWRLDRHELEYGVTAIPLVVVLGGAAIGLARVAAHRVGARIDARGVALVACVGLILLVPLALNTYSPEWNAALKKVPLLKSASTLVRWYCVYIPLAAIVCALCVRLWPVRLRLPVAAGGVVAVVVLNLVADRTWYGLDGYAPERIVHAYEAVRAGAAPPPIRDITVFADSHGRAILPLDRNDVLVAGHSQLLCYNPIFGYRLETFPMGDLHPGPVRDTAGGRYNVKNPACYVFPQENGCVPGEHFRTDQTEAMENFVAYRPFAFERSPTQRVADSITLLGLAVSGLILGGAAVGASLRRLR